ncbi:MAG: hypothetical protein H2041_01265 [Phenylobacterium sp.]|uniref:hypothetical protein n=1 Tax=Phenylobacterium sp. TaxID=1871053 RepID=UPI00182133E7|nr:hypothetical protein [Phenylobacterium sp.]MBA4792275.1 hypothetical protein [Phenylobacterium sp.]
MSIQGALAASLRRFDPSPGAILDLRFKGDSETGYRPFFKREGIIYPTARQVRQFSSAGGAGFARARINGDWRAWAANDPAIGDDGLESWEARQEILPLSCRPAEAAWGVTPVEVQKTSGPTYSGIFQSADVASNGANWNRLTIPNGQSVVAGQLYSVVVRVVAGTSGRIYVGVRDQATTNISYYVGLLDAPVASGTQTAGTFTLIENVMETASIRRLVFHWTPNFTGGINNTGVGPGSPVVGETIRLLGISIQPGPYIASPPIDNDNLAATRTATDYRIGGLYADPTHYGVARVFWAAADGASESPFPVAFEFASAAGPMNRVLWRRATTTSSLIVRVGDVNIFTTNTPAVAGTWETVAWRCKAGDYAMSLNGGPLSGGNNATALPPLTTLGLLGASQGVANIGNNKMSRFAIWNGDISDAALRDLSARVSNA